MLIWNRNIERTLYHLYSDDRFDHARELHLNDVKYSVLKKNIARYVNTTQFIILPQKWTKRPPHFPSQPPKIHSLPKFYQQFHHFVKTFVTKIFRLGAWIQSRVHLHCNKLYTGCVKNSWQKSSSITLVAIGVLWLNLEVSKIWAINFSTNSLEYLAQIFLELSCTNCFSSVYILCVLVTPLIKLKNAPYIRIILFGELQK